MARPPHLTSDLTSRARRDAFLPSTGGPVSNSDILEIAEELLGEDIYPAMNQARGKLLAGVWDIPMHAGSTYDEPWGYPLPSEGMPTLDSVSYVAPDGSESPLTHYAEREWHQFSDRPASGASRPYGYTLRGGQVLVFDHPTTPETGARIRIHMVARPLRLAEHSTPDLYLEIDQAPVLASSSVRLNVVDAGLLSSAWGTNPSTYDLIALSAAPPHLPTDFYAKAHVTVDEGNDRIDVAVANWTRGSSETAVPGRATVGDFIVSDYKTPIIQLPEEAWRALIDGVVMVIADNRGQADKFRRREKMYMQRLEKLPGKLTPRVQEESQTFTNNLSATRLRLRGRHGSLGWRVR